MGLLNFEWMRFYNMMWSFAYIIIYCLCIIYILMSSFMIIFIDSYRRVVLQYGSPMQTLEHGPHYEYNHFKNWTMFFRWFFGWLPDTCVKRIGKNQDQNEDANNVENN
jgi:hypothetical protein